MRSFVTWVLVFSYLSACQTTRYIADGGEYSFRKPEPTEKVVRSVEREIAESYFLFGSIPVNDYSRINDYIELKDNESLVNMQITNRITGSDFWIMFGLCLLTACLSNVVWNKRTTIVTGDVVVDAP